MHLAQVGASAFHLPGFVIQTAPGHVRLASIDFHTTFPSLPPTTQLVRPSAFQFPCSHYLPLTVTQPILSGHLHVPCSMLHAPYLDSIDQAGCVTMPFMPARFAAFSVTSDRMPPYRDFLRPLWHRTDIVVRASHSVSSMKVRTLPPQPLPCTRRRRHSNRPQGLYLLQSKSDWSTQYPRLLTASLSSISQGHLIRVRSALLRNWGSSPRRS